MFMVVYILIGFSKARPRSELDVSRQKKIIKKLWEDVASIKSTLRAQTRKSCPSGYVRFKRSCFRFLMDEVHKATWAASEQYCLSQGGHLVTVDSARKEKFIKKYLRKNFKAYSSSQGGTLLYTGLIYTNEDARLPLDPLGPLSTTVKDANGFRWTATGRAPGEGSNWRPDFSTNIKSPDEWHSCIVLKFDPKSSVAVFWWRGYTCSNEKHNFICEVRLPKRP